MVTLSKKILPSLALSLILLIDSVRIFAWAEMPRPARLQLFGSLAKDLLPCQWTNETSSLHQSGLLSVQFNFSYCPTASNTSAWSSDHYNAFRIHVALDATSTAATSWPITFFVKEQNTGSSLSFSVPTQPEGFSLSFFDVSQTLYMCPAKHNCKNVSLINEHPLVYVYAFTTSEEPLGYSIMIEPVRDFILEFGETYSAVISPSSPQIFYFKIPDNVDIVSVKVTSESEGCAIVSAMNIDISCPPINELLGSVRNEGIRQTMSSLAFLTFQASQVQNREVLLMIVAINDTVCHPHQDSISNDTNFEQIMMITIEELKPTSEYWIAILLPVVIILLVIYPFVFIVVFGCFPKAHLVPVCQLKKPCECVCPCPCVGSDSNSEEEESISLLMHGTGDDTNNDDDTGDHLIMSERSYSPKALPSDQQDQVKGIEEEKPTDGDLHATNANEKDEAGPMRMTSRDYNQLSSQYSMYGWNTIIVGVFYALPILQFVLSEQLYIYIGGDQDTCFYNYKCVHPLGIINTFNGVWSNIPFLLLGLLFMLVVTVRRWIYLEKREKDEHYVDSHGVPQLFGIYYGLGFALIFQGLLSSFYHCCPNESNYGFDIAFHFVIGGLLVVKVFQNRHPDIHTNSFAVFFAAAIIIFFSSYGADFSQKRPLAFQLSLFAIFLLLLAVFLVSLYHLHCWKWVLALHLLTNPRTAIREFFRNGPRHRILLIKLLVAFIINVILVVIVTCLYATVDVARAILILFIFNVFFFVSMYLLSKLLYRESLTWLAIILPFVIVTVWGGAIYFLVGTPSRQDLSPAESRELNKECTLLGFYDNHDIWHFLAAFGLFFSFLFVLVLDDGVANVKRENLNIF